MAETVVIDRKEVVKAKAVAFIVNMLIAELLNRSRREEGYRDYFDIAVLGYHGDEVASLWKNPNRMFMRPNDLIGNELSRVPVQRERRLPDGQYRRIVGLPEDLGGALCGRQNADVSCADRVLPALQSVVRREGAPEELSRRRSSTLPTGSRPTGTISSCRRSPTVSKDSLPRTVLRC